MFARYMEGHTEISNLGAQGSGGRSPEKLKGAGSFHDLKEQPTYPEGLLPPHTPRRELENSDEEFKGCAFYPLKQSYLWQGE